MIQMNASNALKKELNALKREKRKLKNEVLPYELEQLRKAKEENEKLRAEREKLRLALEKKNQKLTRPSSESDGPSRYTAGKFQLLPAPKHTQPEHLETNAKAQHAPGTQRIPQTEEIQPRERARVPGTERDVRNRVGRTVPNAATRTQPHPKETQKKYRTLRERGRANGTNHRERVAPNALISTARDYRAVPTEARRPCENTKEVPNRRYRDDVQEAHANQDVKANKSHHRPREKLTKLKLQELERTDAAHRHNRVKEIRENPKRNRIVAHPTQPTIETGFRSKHAGAPRTDEREKAKMDFRRYDAKEAHATDIVQVDKSQHRARDKAAQDTSKQNQRTTTNVRETGSYGMFGKQPKPRTRSPAREFAPVRKERNGDYTRRRTSPMRKVDDKRALKQRDAPVLREAQKRDRAAKIRKSNTKLAVSNLNELEPTQAAPRYRTRTYEAPVKASRTLPEPRQAARNGRVMHVPGRRVVERDPYASPGTGVKRRQSSPIPEYQKPKKRRIAAGRVSQAATFATKKSHKGTGQVHDADYASLFPRRRVREEVPRRRKDYRKRRQGSVQVQDDAKAAARRRFVEEDILYRNPELRHLGRRMVPRDYKPRYAAARR